MNTEIVSTGTGRCTESRIRECNARLADPARLAAVERTQLLNTPKDQAFDRLARIAAEILEVPFTIISLVGEKSQFFKAGHGLPSPYDVTRELPIDASICRYTVSGEEIIADDATLDPLLRNLPATRLWGVRAFVALPIFNEEGLVLGAFCAIDTKTRHWKPSEIKLMREWTASAMTEIRLHSKIRELEAERELREQFVATLSHDLRTPLSITQMAAQLLDEGVEGEERDKVLQLIGDNITRADQMIQDLLNVNMIKAGKKVHLDYTDCNLEELIHTTVQALNALHGPRFVAKISSPCRGFWDAHAVRRMIENLAQNAVKYGSANTPISITVNGDGHRVCISVHNSGNPIARESIESLFGAFQRSASAAHRPGWGIGLTLVRGFAEAHGGTVHAESSAETGTVFTIDLPTDSRKVS